MICLADLIIALLRTRMQKEMELEKIKTDPHCELSSVTKLETEIDLLNSLVESLVD